MADGVILLPQVSAPRAGLIANSGSRRRLAPPIALRNLLLFLALLTLPAAVFAHRLDEFLQATIVVVEPDHVRLQINLTPGVAVAGQVLALIDRNRDGMISTNEAGAYCELVKRELVVQLDHRDLKLILTSSYFPGAAELRTGWGFIQMEFSATPGKLSAGPHSLTIENRHLRSVSVYLVNAAQPASGSVQIIKQTRNENQSSGEIEFGFRPSPKANLMKRF
jgi:hypothetical protein